jgi:hypothetical protein
MDLIITISTSVNDDLTPEQVQKTLTHEADKQALRLLELGRHGSVTVQTPYPAMQVLVEV